MNGNADNKNTGLRAPGALTVFSYVVAANNLVQLVFFYQWYARGDPLGWAFLVLSIAVFLFPGRIRLFAAMLAASVVYYVSIMPVIPNHAMADILIVLSILSAAMIVLGKRLFSLAPLGRSDADAWFAKFAPVAGAIFTFVYYAIVLSKLNEGFFDLSISCLSMMHQDFMESHPIFGGLTLNFSSDFLLWVFIVVEVSIPLLLTIGRTRLLAMYIGVPFHVLLGLMGHWAFSSMMLAFYVLAAMPALLELLESVADRLETVRRKLIPWAPSMLLFVGLNAALLGTFFLGVKPIRIWLIWTVPLAAALLLATLQSHYLNGPLYAPGSTAFWTWKPGWLWIMLGLAVINSASPYIGFKTTTAVTMYSNLRTEGGKTNHFFMPNLGIFGFQDDLVEIVDSNHEAVRALRKAPARFGFPGQEFDITITWFELRRVVSGLRANDLEITYIRNGERRVFRRGSPDNQGADLDRPPPSLLAKLAYFRPVFKDKAYCLW